MTMVHSSNSRAILTHAPQPDGKPNLTLEEINLRETLKPDEVLVRMVATGICHTDFVFAQEPTYSAYFPRVLGHEGAGYVEAVGSSVTVAKAGDAVLLSFSSCRSCLDCKSGHPAYCDSFMSSNAAGEDGIFTCENGGRHMKVLGSFFGQSSFASRTIVKEASVVNVEGLIDGEDDLKLFAPMGCGFQTGMGTVDHFAGAGPHDTVLVLGLGGVGLAAISAAKIAGAQTIIAVDRVAARLELAMNFGATKVMNTSTQNGSSLTDQISVLSEGRGASITIDTTGNVDLIKAGLEMTSKRGQMILLGVAAFTAEIPINLGAFMQSGKSFRGSIEGDVIPSLYIPKMIEWYRNGQFQIEKLVKFYKIEDYETAFRDMKSGKVIKPVLIW